MIRASQAPPAPRPAISLRGQVRLWPLGVGVALALLSSTACVAPATRPVSSAPALADEAQAAVADGVRLYEAGEYAMAARRFQAGSDLAQEMRDLPLAWRATAAECTSWLLARDLRLFDACSLRLESIQARNHESSGGTNALIALGAVAGGRPQPNVNIPSPVRNVMRPGEETLR